MSAIADELCRRYMCIQALEAENAALRERVAEMEGAMPKRDPLRVLAGMDEQYGCWDEPHDSDNCVRCKAGSILNELSDIRHEEYRHDPDLMAALDAIAALPAAPTGELAARRLVLSEDAMPPELFDGYAVLKAIPKGKHVSADHVALVLDAAVRLIRNRTESNLLERAKR